MAQGPSGLTGDSRDLDRELTRFVTVVGMNPTLGLCWLLCGGIVCAQNVLFEERFDRGIPAEWMQLQRGIGPDRWLAGTNPVTGSADAYHEYFCNHGQLFRDNLLVTPPIGLRGLSQATLVFDDHQILPTWRLYNGVRASLAGGPFVPIHVVTRNTGGIVTVRIDLTPLLGHDDVRFAFHYQGDIANEWRIDNVLVTTLQPVLQLTNLAAGRAAQVSLRGTPGNACFVGFSFSGPGPLATPVGQLLLTPPVELLPLVVLDGAGTWSMSLPIPAGLTGVPLWSQAAMVTPGNTVHWSNARFDPVR